MASALDGVRVLDLSRMLPGPYAGMILADLGADVLKVEDTAMGDPTRWVPRHRAHANSTFEIVNRNKRSLSLNLKSSEGRDVFRALVREADIVLEGFRPGVMDRLGIGYQSLRQIQPRILFCSISGYGQDGPMRERSGHDVNYLALSGVLGLQTDREGSPVLSGIQVADLGGALFAVIGILAALAARERTGMGQLVDVSMMDVGIALLPVAAARHFAGEPVPTGSRLPLSGGLACYNLYETADGRHLSVGALEGKFWARFCEVIERRDFIPIQLSEERQPELIREVGRILKTRNLDDWMQRFRATDACVEPVLSVTEALDSPQVRHRQTVFEAECPGGTRVRQLALPFILSETPAAFRSPAPALGEHSRQVLESLGYAEEEIQRLLHTAVVKQP